MTIFGTKSLVVLCTILMYESTKFLIVSTCRSRTGSDTPRSSFYKCKQFCYEFIYYYFYRVNNTFSFSASNLVFSGYTPALKNEAFQDSTSSNVSHDSSSCLNSL